MNFIKNNGLSVHKNFLSTLGFVIVSVFGREKHQ